MRRLVALLFVVALMGGCKRQGRAKALPPEDTAPLASVLQMGDKRQSVQLVKGFHPVENDWRWTARQFAVAVRPPDGSGEAQLEFRFVVPQAVLDRVGPLTLSAKAGGVDLASQKFEKDGPQVYQQPVPASALKGEAVALEFSFDKALAPSGGETRELAVVAQSIGLTRR
jgi:hypothetical protein